jgi:hypothetical protein
MGRAIGLKRVRNEIEAVQPLPDLSHSSSPEVATGAPRGGSTIDVPGPSMHPLSTASNLYALRDEKGKIIGTGRREVCEVLLYILSRCAEFPPIQQGFAGARPNVRAAISING